MLKHTIGADEARARQARRQHLMARLSEFPLQGEQDVLGLCATRNGPLGCSMTPNDKRFETL